MGLILLLLGAAAIWAVMFRSDEFGIGADLQRVLLWTGYAASAAGLVTILM